MTVVSPFRQPSRLRAAPPQNCPSMAMSVYGGTSRMEITLDPATAQDDEPEIASYIDVASETGSFLPSGPLTAFDVSGENHCLQPWTGSGSSGNSCGARTILLMRVAFTDASPTYATEAQIRSYMWTATAGTDAISADALIRASSYNQTWFDEAASDVITVNLGIPVSAYNPGTAGNSPSSGCAYRSMQTAANAAAVAAGFDLDAYQHLGYYIPSTSSLGCNWGVSGMSVGGTPGTAATAAV